jgi:threonine/homoserine/homoserine lactone efflux protein
VASTGVLLFLSSCATAIIHALIPDHWLPFVLMARTEKWSERRTVLLVALAGLIHVMVSFAVAAAVIMLGSSPARHLAERAGTSLELLAGLLLVLFGLVYGIGAHYREARAHSHGGSGSHGPPGHIHAHGHLLERWFHGAITPGALVAIIGVSPCILLQPILFGAAARGPLVTVATAAGFAICTLGTMVGVTMVASHGMRRLELPFFTRYGDLLSGMLIAGIGIFVIVQEL